MKIVLLDLETTGTNNKNHEITQVGFAVFNEKLMIEEVYDELIGLEYPERYTDAGAMSISGITPEDLQNEEKFENKKIYHILKKLDTSENYLIAHNAPFDCGFLRKYDLCQNMKVIDTLRLAKMFCTGSLKHKLQYLRYDLRLYRSSKNLQNFKGYLEESKEISAHDAISDVIYLKDLLDYIMSSEGKTIEQLYEIQNKPIIIDKMPFGKYKGLEIKKIKEMDISYLNWCLSSDMDKDLKDSIKHFINIK